MADGLTTLPAPLVDVDAVLRDPHSLAGWLVESGDVYGLTAAEVRIAKSTMVCFWLTLEPWAPMAAKAYPTERVAITAFRDGRVAAVPVAARQRRWLHRNPMLLGDMRHLGELCLWFPKDPRGLRWEWGDGFIAFITIVHRHLQAEEFWRRNHYWPSEDAPHGYGDHPIRTPAMRLLALEGANS